MREHNLIFSQNEHICVMCTEVKRELLAETLRPPIASLGTSEFRKYKHCFGGYQVQLALHRQVASYLQTQPEIGGKCFETKGTSVLNRCFLPGYASLICLLFT